jgi:hypothetical protein
VLAKSLNVSDPIATAVAGWIASPPHNALLSDPSLTRIACGTHMADGWFYAACVLAVGPSIQSVPAPIGRPAPTVPVLPVVAVVAPVVVAPAAPVTLPDTAVPNVPSR